MMKKLLLMLVAVLVACCSAPLPEDATNEPGVDDVVQQALTVCKTTGSSGSSTWPAQTVITGIKVAPNYFGRRLIVTACDIVGTYCESATHEFFNVSWHEINGHWVGSKAWPLRRIAIRPPGCYIGNPEAYCMSLYGDSWAGDHVNEGQNAAMFWFDPPASASPVNPFGYGANIEAPFGTGIAQLVGDVSPPNTWRVKPPNATNTGMSTSNILFNSTGCP